VIDLGVRVPSEKILLTAIEQNVDVIGLSGLITPSLEEMVHVAKEMQRMGLSFPLIIGGATTSEIHTAVRIDPQYSAPVIHVRDASRSAGVLSGLMSSENKKTYGEKIKLHYQDLRRQYEDSRLESQFVSLREARENRLKLNFSPDVIQKPSFTGNKYFYDFPLAELREYIDWTFFFHAWKINGKYPAIFEDPVKGSEAIKLFDDAQKMLDEMVMKKMILAKGVIGFYPCNSSGDDVEIYADELRSKIIAIFHFLRNQQKKEASSPNLCLADFIAPGDKGLVDYIGCFAVTAGLGIEEWVRYFESQLDDYSAILIKILSDRLAEAFAERLHQLVRKEYWGYAREENLDVMAILREEYLGIRPAPGYPACPEHSEKNVLFSLLDPEKQTGISLTENFSMVPAASVSGYYFAHPESHYFALGKIGKDQVSDYARRKNISLELAEKLLKTNLNY
jgi:5-methyltetrahydrofolate--homocysteine methyltransferase